MKNILIKFATLIMVLALTLSFVGCGLFEASTPTDNGGGEIVNQTPGNGESGNGESGNGESGNGSSGSNGNYNGGVGNLPTIEEITKKAVLGKIEGERTLKDKVGVIADVKNSVVAITCGTSVASGVIVDIKLTDKDGNVLDGANDIYVMTCHHVVDGKGDITVYIPDAEMDNHGESDYDEQNYSFTGKIGEENANQAVSLIGGDQKSDVALLKMKINDNTVLNGITKAKFPADDYKMQDGEDVISIGNASGSAPNHKEIGIISYMFRETSISGIGDMTLLEHTADIEHGSSGGGLFNMYGEIIGLTNAGSDIYTSINYAVPYQIEANNKDDFGFVNVLGQLLVTKTDSNYGYVSGRAGLFGFTTVQEANSNKVEITEISENSIAYGKLYVGDTILKAVKGDKSGLASAPTVTGNSDVTKVFKSLRAGDKVSLLVSRAGAGNVQVEMMAVQYIFCDTGIYN